MRPLTAGPVWMHRRAQVTKSPAQPQLLQQSQQQSARAQPVEFKCGKMKKNDGDTRVTPDLRKGKLTVRADQDQLMHFIWTNREQGASCARGLAPLSAPARPQSPGGRPLGLRAATGLNGEPRLALA